MKKLLQIFFISAALFLIFCFCGFAVQMGNCWTYDGELNPDDFDTWEVVSVAPCPSGAPHAHVLIQSSYGLFIELKVDSAMNLLAYFYTKDGVDYEFTYDPETEHYTQVKPKTEWPDPVDEYSSFSKPI